MKRQRPLPYSLISSLHLAVHDKSDESLLNDYEQLLAAARGSSGPILDLFEGMVRSVVLEDPVSGGFDSIGRLENTGIADRLVQGFAHSHQRKAMQDNLGTQPTELQIRSGGRATWDWQIAHDFGDCFRRHPFEKAFLILSDKREALDVVEDKLVQTLASVRPSGVDFPNPILRLGKESNNFRSLLPGLNGAADPGLSSCIKSQGRCN